MSSMVESSSEGMFVLYDTGRPNSSVNSDSGSDSDLHHHHHHNSSTVPTVIATHTPPPGTKSTQTRVRFQRPAPPTSEPPPMPKYSKEDIETQIEILLASRAADDPSSSMASSTGTMGTFVENDQEPQPSLAALLLRSQHPGQSTLPTSKAPMMQQYFQQQPFQHQQQPYQHQPHVSDGGAPLWAVCHHHKQPESDAHHVHHKQTDSDDEEKSQPKQQKTVISIQQHQQDAPHHSQQQQQHSHQQQSGSHEPSPSSDYLSGGTIRVMQNVLEKKRSAPQAQAVRTGMPNHLEIGSSSAAMALDILALSHATESMNDECLRVGIWNYVVPSLMLLRDDETAKVLQIIMYLMQKNSSLMMRGLDFLLYLLGYYRNWEFKKHKTSIKHSYSWTKEQRARVYPNVVAAVFEADYCIQVIEAARDFTKEQSTLHVRLATLRKAFLKLYAKNTGIPHWRKSNRKMLKHAFSQNLSYWERHQKAQLQNA